MSFVDLKYKGDSKQIRLLPNRPRSGDKSKKATTGPTRRADVDTTRSLSRERPGTLTLRSHPPPGVPYTNSNSKLEKKKGGVYSKLSGHDTNSKTSVARGRKKIQHGVDIIKQCNLDFGYVNQKPDKSILLRSRPSSSAMSLKSEFQDLISTSVKTTTTAMKSAFKKGLSNKVGQKTVQTRELYDRSERSKKVEIVNSYSGRKANSRPSSAASRTSTTSKHSVKSTSSRSSRAASASTSHSASSSEMAPPKVDQDVNVSVFTRDNLTIAPKDVIVTRRVSKNQTTILVTVPHGDRAQTKAFLKSKIGKLEICLARSDTPSSVSDSKTPTVPEEKYEETSTNPPPKTGVTYSPPKTGITNSPLKTGITYSPLKTGISLDSGYGSQMSQEPPLSNDASPIPAIPLTVPEDETRKEPLIPPYDENKDYSIKETRNESREEFKQDINVEDIKSMSKEDATITRETTQEHSMSRENTTLSTRASTMTQNESTILEKIVDSGYSSPSIPDSKKDRSQSPSKRSMTKQGPRSTLSRGKSARLLMKPKSKKKPKPSPYGNIVFPKSLRSKSDQMREKPIAPSHVEQSPYGGAARTSFAHTFAQDPPQALTNSTEKILIKDKYRSQTLLQAERIELKKKEFTSASLPLIPTHAGVVRNKRTLHFSSDMVMNRSRMFGPDAGIAALTSLNLDNL